MKCFRLLSASSFAFKCICLTKITDCLSQQKGKTHLRVKDHTHNAWVWAWEIVKQEDHVIRRRARRQYQIPLYGRIRAAFTHSRDIKLKRNSILYLEIRGSESYLLRRRSLSSCLYPKWSPSLSSSQHIPTWSNGRSPWSKTMLQLLVVNHNKPSTRLWRDGQEGEWDTNDAIRCEDCMVRIRHQPRTNNRLNTCC